MSEIPDSYTETLSNEIAPTGAWNLSGRKLKILWEEIHPVIVAYSWKDARFRCNCEQEGDVWKAKVVNEVAKWLGYEKFEWKSRWRIEFSSGPTHLRMSTNAIILPWPAKPSSVSDMMVRYSIVGGLFPASTLPPFPRSIKTLTKELKKHEKECDEETVVRRRHDYLQGDSILKLINQVTMIVARGLTDESFYRKYNKNPKDVITDISFPKSIRLRATTNIYHDILINPENGSIYIDLPLIDEDNPVPEMDMIINNIIIRNASNPMYSNCY